LKDGRTVAYFDDIPAKGKPEISVIF